MGWTRDKAMKAAEASADRQGLPVAVVNLNPVTGNNFVVRDWRERYEGLDYVTKVMPNPTRGQTLAEVIEATQQRASKAE